MTVETQATVESSEKEQDVQKELDAQVEQGAEKKPTDDMSNKETLVLVDGSSLAFRSFFALLTTGLRTKTGVPTWAILGFFNSLFDLFERTSPNCVAVCFDLSAPTFRHVEYDQYKAHRDAMPDDLAVQWPFIKEGIKALGIPIYEVAGYEADDIIGTVALRAKAEGRKVKILTGDQDIFQMVDEDPGYIEIMMPGKKGLLSYKRGEVYAKLGVWPEQIIDYKGLCGDTSDNIPGVRGVGPVTAVKLLSEYKTLEGIYENIDSIKGAVQKKLQEGRDNAFISKKLATIHYEVPVDFDLETCRLTLPDLQQAGKFFKSLQFRALISRLPAVLSKFSCDSGESRQQLEARINQVFKDIQVDLLMFEGPVMQNTFGVDGLGKPDRSATMSDVLASIPAQQTGPIIEIPKITEPPKPLLVETEEQLTDLVNELANTELLTLDLETYGVDSLDTGIVGWAFAWGDGLKKQEDGTLLASDGTDHLLKTAYVPVGHQYIGTVQLAPELVAEKLKPIIEDKKIGKIAQNAKFESNVLSLYGIKLESVVFDPMLASYIVNPDDKHGLKDQTERILNYSMTRIKEIIRTGSRHQITMENASVDQSAPYAADDARCTYELARYYAKRFDDEQKFLMYQMELPLSAVLAKMEQTGVGLDVDHLKKYSKELAHEMVRCEKAIFDLAGHAFNINSTKQLQQVLFEELGLDTKGRTQTGFSTDAAVLESLKDAHPIVANILEFRHMSKLRSTYVDALPKQISQRDGRLHGEFNQTVAATGRLSSSNPNLQNIPIRTELGRNIRRAFVGGAPNSSLISADYSQIELRMLAHMSGDETLLDAFAQNQDIHARTAMEIFDVPFDKVDSDMRSVGKTINFALVYQQGAFATAQGLGISTREAQGFIDKYFARMPKVKDFINETIEQARADNFVSTLWGRRRYFKRLQDRNTNVRRADERAACNAPLQGSAADLMKLAMIELDKKLIASKSNAKLILQVHDELVLEVPDDEIEEAKQIVGSAMELEQPLKVNLKVDFGVGKNWMDTK